MSEPVVVTRVVCSRTKKPHIIGKVYATAAGLVLDLTTPAHAPSGVIAIEQRLTRSTDASQSCEAFCATCDKIHEAHLDVIFAAAAVRKRQLPLIAQGMSRDPIGVLSRSRSAKPR